MKALKWQLMQSKLSVLMPSIKFVNKCIQTQRLSTRRFNRQTAMLLSLESHLILRKWDFMCFIAEKLRSQEAELTGRVGLRAMHTKPYNSWKASLYDSKNLANSSIVHGTTSSFSFVRSIKRRNWYTSCDMSSKLPLYSFMNADIGGSRKFYTWWTLSGIREVTTWIFSWSSLNYRVGQKVAKFGVFSDRTRKLSALTPERGRIL